MEKINIMPHGKTHSDPFGLGSFESATNKKKLSQQPTMKNNVPCEHTTSGSRPSSSRTVKGMPDRLK